MFEDFAGLFARLSVRASLVFVGILLCDICGSFSVETAPGAVTTHSGGIASGAGSRMEPIGPYLGTAQ
jgi:hypothetical protein